ncbi:hypothetical protein FRC03_008246 [Tulasnella sp. 419]|nr:hypothetical protein FRC02_011664 [Tulasnella sp. 418]KAG8937344.1 hypothetical protein FRC03_008246 [Tulasnella sp. 419]
MQVSYVPVAQNYAGDSVLTQSEWFMSLIGCTAHFWHSSTLKEGVNVAALSLISGRHQTAVIAALSPKTKFLLTARGQLDTDLQIWRVQSEAKHVS